MEKFLKLFIKSFSFFFVTNSFEPLEALKEIFRQAFIIFSFILLFFFPRNLENDAKSYFLAFFWNLLQSFDTFYPIFLSFQSLSPLGGLKIDNLSAWVGGKEISNGRVWFSCLCSYLRR